MLLKIMHENAIHANFEEASNYRHQINSAMHPFFHRGQRFREQGPLDKYAENHF